MAYTRVNWEDLPSTNTPRNAANLNNMDAGIKENNNMLTGDSSMGNVIVESIESKNKFDKNTALKNAWLGESGQINIYTNDNLVSGYIPVKPNTSYTASGYLANKYLKICGYNSNKVFTQIIIDINSSQTYQTITTGPNDYFIRVGYGDSVSTPDTLQFEKGSVVTPFSPYQDLDNSGTLLFDGESTSADIQLLDSLTKYEYVDIIYGNIYSGIKKIKFKVLNSNTFVLSSTELDLSINNFGVAIVNSKYTFDTNYLRYNGASRIFKYENDNNWVQDRVNSNYIYRVVGY